MEEPKRTRRSWSAEDLERLRVLYMKRTPIPRVAEELGRREISVRVTASQLRKKQPGWPHVPSSAAVGDEPSAAPLPTDQHTTYTEDGDTATATLRTHERIHTLEQLVERMQIDLVQWRVREWTANAWEVGAKDPAGRILTAPLYQVKAKLERNQEAIRVTTLRDALLNDIRAEARPELGRPPLVLISREDRERNLLVLPRYDLHLGKLGLDYGSDTSERLARWSLEHLLERARGYKIEQIVVAYSEVLHTEDGRGTTKGTPQDADLLWLDAMRRARALMSWEIRTATQVAPVVAYIIPGNHAYRSEVALGEVLAAEFSRSRRVQVRNEGPRQYHAFGSTLLGLTHGSEEKHRDLPGLMACEVPSLWGASSHREWILGHLHTASSRTYLPLDEISGVRIRRVAALSPKDSWHHAHGYVTSVKAAEALVYNRATGFEAHLSANVTTQQLQELRTAA
jgi:hypothetical protein